MRQNEVRDNPISESLRLALRKRFPGPAPEFFFAPAVLDRLSAEMGAGELQRRIGADWIAFLVPLSAILEIEETSGPDAVERVYRAFLDGSADPRKGHVLNL